MSLEILVKCTKNNLYLQKESRMSRQTTLGEVVFKFMLILLEITIHFRGQDFVHLKKNMWSYKALVNEQTFFLLLNFLI